MKPLIDVYYDFIQDFDYDIIKYMNDYFYLPEKYKTIINVCQEYIQNKKINYNNLLDRFKPSINMHSPSGRKYMKKIFEINSRRDINIYMLKELINIKPHLDDIIKCLKEDDKLNNFANKLKDEISNMISLVFYRILFDEYQRLGNTVYFKGNFWDISRLSHKKFKELYDESEHVRNILKNIGEVIYKYKFIENDLKHFTLTKKILWIENNTDTNILFNKYYQQLVPYKYNISSAANEVEIKSGFSKLTYELSAGL
jgi:hypothetical protein